MRGDGRRFLRKAHIQHRADHKNRSDILNGGPEKLKHQTNINNGRMRTKLLVLTGWLALQESENPTQKLL